MLIAIDVYYYETKARAVSLEFETWQSETALQSHVVELDEVEAYISGEFYKRELPCILKVLAESNLTQVEAIILDSYVVLNDEGKPGLGAYLYEALNHAIPIVGVAKKKFLSNEKNAKAVFRGTSERPLYVSSIGIDLEEAAENVQHMVGPYRMPNLLKQVDQLTRAENAETKNEPKDN